MEADCQRGYTMSVDLPVARKIAVIGAGPAGLGCVEVLVQKGHEVIIFEYESAFGGLPVDEINNFKHANDVWQERREEFEHAGVKFVRDTYICENKTVDDFFEEGFDAVFIDVDSEIDRKMENTPGKDLSGVYEAADFLIRANVDSNRPPLEVGRRAVVIGGGDVASDCLRTALRLGSDDVICLCCRAENEMFDGENVRRPAREEGAKYRFLTQPVKFIAGADGRLAAVECVDMKLGEPNAKGRRITVPVEGSNFSVAADTVILALGYWTHPIPGKDKHKAMTSQEGVFTGGDCAVGSDATVDGRKVALAIDEYLRNKK
jgi:glutamate synthase (NADPH) small chain